MHYGLRVCLMNGYDETDYKINNWGIKYRRYCIEFTIKEFQRYQAVSYVYIRPLPLLPLAPSSNPAPASYHDHAQESSHDRCSSEYNHDRDADGPFAGRKEGMERVVCVDKGLRERRRKRLAAMEQ